MKMVILLGLGFSVSVFAQSFHAELDRNRISQEESVSVHFVLKSESSVSLDDVKYQAPDLEAVNEYSGTSIQSSYVNGKFQANYEVKKTIVFRPLKSGKLKIDQIQAKVGSRVFSSPPLVVEVLPSGAGTPGAGGALSQSGGSGAGLRGSSKPDTSKRFFLEAEVSKSNLYKGEQVIISYYLYRRMPVLGISEVRKFPQLNGFYREELDRSALNPQTWKTERVMVQGRAYEKSLMMRFSAYPVREGKLRVDPLSLKIIYRPTRDGEEDFDPFQSFFSQMRQEQAYVVSESLSLDVKPLPEEGRTAQFKGGVGDFFMDASLSKAEVKANEPVTLSVVLRGKGNSGAVQNPEIHPPKSIEVFETKGNSQVDAGGVGTKVFETVLIPREAGEFQIPEITMQFFDPDQKTYYLRKTQALSLKVLPGNSSSPSQKDPKNLSQDEKEIGEQGRGFQIHPETLWRVFYFVLGLGVLSLLWLSFRKIQKKRKNKKEIDSVKEWKKRLSALLSGLNSKEDILKAYEACHLYLLENIDQKYAIEAKARSRYELKKILVEEKGISLNDWSVLEQVLDRSEQVQFAGLGAVPSSESARQEIQEFIGKIEVFFKN